MKPLTCSIHINASPDAVFAACSDIPHAPDRIRGIKRVEMLTAGPVGLGTKFRETRIMFKREATETFEFTAFEPPVRYEVEATSCGIEFRSDFHFIPEGNGTRIEITMSGRAKTFFSKLMTPLGGLMAGTMKKCVMEDLADIKASVEGNR